MLRRAAEFARLFRRLFMVLIVVALPAHAQETAEVNALKKGLELMRDGKWDEALEAAGDPGDLPRDIIQWNRLRAGEGTFEESLAFLERHPDWPGEDLLRERTERNIPSDALLADVLRFFQGHTPETGTGAIRYARALWESGAQDAAMAEARRAWTEMSLASSEEDQFMHDWPKTLADYHWERMDSLLWAGRTSQAERHMARVTTDQQILARARIGLRETEAGVDDMIAKVPEALADDPGLAYERMLWRLRKGRIDDAIEMVLDRSDSAEDLGRPLMWGDERRRFAREKMREGEAQVAYDIAANHFIDEAVWDREDNEWIAGFVALRMLDDPEAAVTHFRNFRATVDTPISQGRAGYWEGRALEAADRTAEAEAAYAFGAQHQTAFYGLLAAEKAGVPMDPKLAGTEAFPDFETASFWGTPIMEAARLTAALDEYYLTQRFVVHLSERLDRTETGQLADWAESVDLPYVMLKIAKHSVNFDKVLERAYFPTPDIGKGHPEVPRALEMAISRRESEFNHTVRSHAGALGLMQLMPGTARDMASRLGIDYEQSRLTTDMEYNARLGSEYLAWLKERFGNNPVLISVAYNAGLGRAYRWSEERGDPRDPDVDVIDWIEMIPFEETQNYVMRVTETLPIYEARLTGEVVPLDFTAMLKRR
ncbi:lytic transglycosylase domain-containing protein [Maritimibacter sp. UBA3975]|uniref:lytic transglycosylase domain-containing protein n=1 Tax=Maritimibacter sp. UBA3975 TaxID=1946833 RepID=UPI0025B8B8DF|nr:lytic transglycosylase domain-containing protein [Maritimibacter sp. UBA3975]